MENLTIFAVKQATACFFGLLRSSLGISVEHSTTALPPLSETLVSLVIRSDNGDPHRVVNVFDSNGKKKYTIERNSLASKLWAVYAEPERVKVSTISIGLFSRVTATDEPFTTTLKYGPGILGKLHRHFYDSDGELHSWNRRSRVLERISNPAGGHEERRTQVAYLQHLRNYRFDYELIINTDLADEVKALSTAFITLKTQWSRLRSTTLPGVRASRLSNDKFENPKSSENTFVDNNESQLLVYNPREPSKAPRDFFNPPDFLLDEFYAQ